MADEISTQVIESAGSGTPASEAADPTSQGAGQGQEITQGSVDPSVNQGTSSTGTQERKSNSNWAAERVLERKLKGMIAEALKPLQDSFAAAQPPPAPKVESTQDDQPDYNNLSAWIQRKIAEGTQRELSKFQKEKLGPLDGQIEEKLSVREARNFLLSQPEIGGDETKMEELRQIMKDEMLDYAAAYDPVGATRKAFNIWKKQRSNPNAPPKNTLTTVTGGAGSVGKPKAASVDELRQLQKIIASNAPDSEKEVAFKRVDELAKSGS